jgi:hypothetical protein
MTKYRHKLKQPDSTIPIATRLLAVITGLFTGCFFFLGFGYQYLIFPMILIFGAVVQAYWRTGGKWIMGFGAWQLSYVAASLGRWIPGLIRNALIYIEAAPILVTLLVITSVLLVALCDVALVRSIFRIEKNSTV